jgi:ASC-1-like (ASCH) protein
MEIWKNHRKEPYYTFVKNGQKTVEGRLVKGKYAKMSLGDQIIVQTEDESGSFDVKIIGLNRYQSFRDMLEAEGIKNVLPNLDTVEEGILEYYKFYTKEQEKEFGVLAIKVKKL